MSVCFGLGERVLRVTRVTAPSIDRPNLSSRPRRRRRDSPLQTLERRLRPTQQRAVDTGPFPRTQSIDRDVAPVIQSINHLFNHSINHSFTLNQPVTHFLVYLLDSKRRLTELHAFSVRSAIGG